MGITHYMVNKSDIWVPYFGNQRRFSEFVIETLKALDLPSNFKFFETNSGSHAISYHVRSTLDVFTVSNDISLFSEAIGKSLISSNQWSPATKNLNFLQKLYGDGSLFTEIDKRSSLSSTTPIDAAVLGCMLLEIGGYDFVFKGNENFDETLYDYWKTFFLKNAIHKPGIITKNDLFDFIRNNKGHVIYMDFAWPWKDGRDVEEYGKMNDVISSALSQTTQSFPLWNRKNVLDNVLKACSLAVENFQYVILSNQSSNYPTWDILEQALEQNKTFKLIGAKRLTLPAEDVDNRGIDTYFTEYQYILTK